MKNVRWVAVDMAKPIKGREVHYWVKSTRKMRFSAGGWIEHLPMMPGDEFGLLVKRYRRKVKGEQK